MRDLYYFDRDACACFWDKDLIFETGDIDTLSAILGGIPGGRMLDNAVQSPLDPAQNYL